MSRYFPARIEKKWQQRWLKEHVYEPSFAMASKGKPDLKHAKKPFYNLMMFPYPSAEGLHIGGVRTFTGVDIYGRYKRMQGCDVFEPIGLDGFGINSENYALKIGEHPVRVAKRTEKNFYRQLAVIGNGFAWDERLETYDPDYYRWTQWIFVQMFKHGLAYRKTSAVNWCPSCKTVLADEQVISGNCERCGTMVIKKELEQWFLKITKYAPQLLANLEKIDWSENVKIAQRNWIGKSEGAVIQFPISPPEADPPAGGQFPKKSQIPITKGHIKVFTTRPDTLFGATYLVLAPEHEFIKNHESEIKNYAEVADYQKQTVLMAEADRIAEGKEKTGVELNGIRAINPATREEIPVFIADYVLGGVGTGAIMAVPAHDQRDYDFAKKFNLPMKMAVCPHYPAPTCPVLDRAYTGTGHLVDSDKFDGMPSEEAKWAIVKEVGGARKTNFRLRDWLVSRQRYWGAPIPMIFCEHCRAAEKGERKEMPGWYAVAENNLPVQLPFIKNFRPTGNDKSPLASVKSFYQVKCPKCKKMARRETDVCDTFFDSAWYYLRYPSMKDKRHAWDPTITKKWFPVDMYIGGAEHSVLHLLYVRFVAHALHDWKMIPFAEPFTKFRSHGLITKGGAKMSKSRGNVVNPDEYIAAYGTDAMRMYLAFMAPLDQGGDFRDAGIRGITRFLERVNSLVETYEFPIRDLLIADYKTYREKIVRHIHQTIKKVTEDIENLQYNTAISALMILLNEFEEQQGIVNGSYVVKKEDIKIFLKLLAPFAPHITEELWQQHFATRSTLRVPRFHSIHHESWPQYSKELLVEQTHEFAIQVNGKFRDTFTADADVKEDEAVRLALGRERIKTLIAESKPKKIIFVSGRLVNIVL